MKTKSRIEMRCVSLVVRLTLAATLIAGSQPKAPAVAVGAGGPADLADSCTQYNNDCNACTSVGNGTCVYNFDFEAGIGIGQFRCLPANSTFAGGGAKYPSQCRCSLPDNSICRACTSYPGGGCGYCEATDECTNGTAAGPANPSSCPLASWAFNKSSCTSMDCDEGDCTTCLAASGCGWWRHGGWGPGICSSGNATGPYNFNVNKTDWYFDTCPPPECWRSNRDCQACTNSYEGGCGYCEATSECTDGTAAGPANPSSCPLASWAFNSSSCYSMDCGDLLNKEDCSSCLATSGCGWSHGGFGCLPGNATGPYRGNNSQWYFGTCPNLNRNHQRSHPLPWYTIASIGLAVMTCLLMCCWLTWYIRLREKDFRALNAHIRETRGSNKPTDKLDAAIYQRQVERMQEEPSSAVGYGTNQQVSP